MGGGGLTFVARCGKNFEQGVYKSRAVWYDSIMTTTRKRGYRVPDDVLRARIELARSGAAGTHGDRRTKRVRTRAAQKRAALREW